MRNVGGAKRRPAGTRPFAVSCPRHSAVTVLVNPSNSRAPGAAGGIRKAATLLVAREGPRAAAGVELFMVRRPARGAFPNLHVFPGGKVDADDDGVAPFCAGRTDAEASALLDMTCGGLRYWVTAIRECFEECGVLLAYRAGRLFRPADERERERFDAHRDALATGALTFAELLAREELRLAVDRVHYFSHWITPETAPARFDTRFFLALLPPGQRAAEHSRETTAGAWVTPARALANHAAGQWLMIHPTLATLRTVARFSNVDQLLGDVAAGRHQGAIDGSLRDQGQQPR